MLPNISKILSKKQSKKSSIFESIFYNFCADLGPHLGAKLAHLGTMLGFLAPLGAPLGDLGHHHLGSRMLPRRSQSLPDPSQTSIFIDFGTVFLEGFQHPLEQCFKDRVRHGGGCSRASALDKSGAPALRVRPCEDLVLNLKILRSQT